jgi:hypothetical protein
MPFYIEKGEEKKINLKPGIHQAVCSGVFDLYHQLNNYKGKETIKHNAMLMFEMINKDGEVIELNRWYNSITFSTDSEYKSGLQRDLESWGSMTFGVEEIAKGFDLLILYGYNAFVNVQMNKKNRLTIVSISPLPDGMQKISPIRMLEDVPEFVKKIQAKAVENKEQENVNQGQNGWNQ